MKAPLARSRLSLVPLAVLALAARAAAESYPWMASMPSPETPVEVVYRSECAGCHGEKGDGKGIADPDMLPPPRDFTRGKFKLRSSDPRQPPSIEELAETITRGMPGTAMLSFRFLPDQTRRELARYILSFSGTVPGDAEGAIPLPKPPSRTAELIAKGAKLYVELGCPACHGAQGRGDGPAAPSLRDEWGHRNPARDLAGEPFRAGHSDRAIYSVLTLGMPGTPMPGYAEASSELDRWAVVAYLQSIRNPPEPPHDPKKLGEQVLEQRACTACHRLGDRGGRVGPPLEASARKLRLSWMRALLVDSRPEPKVLPASSYRMPQPYLEPVEIDALVHTLAARVGRKYPERGAPIEARDAGVGEQLYRNHCARCHSASPGSPPTAPDLLRLDPAFFSSYVRSADFGAHSNLAPELGLEIPLGHNETNALRAFLEQAGGRRP